MSLRTLRLSERAKEQLTRLKRFTGLKNWNVLCRWALCTSLADSAPLSRQAILADSNVELSWPVLTGNWGDIYEYLLFERCLTDGIEPSDEGMHDLLVRHVHRGIGMLSADVSHDGIRGMLAGALVQWEAAPLASVE